MTRSGITIAGLVVIVVGLASADRFLATVESAEVRASAQRDYAKGSVLLARGDAMSAIDALREAHGLQRQNPEYELELAAALLAAGRTQEAEPLLAEVLQRAPNDGRANLSAARSRARTGDWAEAQAFYHRAIYGEWHENAARHRNEVRMELVNLLVSKSQKQDLLAELIALEAQPDADPAMQKRLAKLFLMADSPARAAAVYQAMLDKDPKDVEADEGLGDADLELGQYHAAHEAYLRAFLREPNNPSVRAHLQTLNTVTTLDPTPRQLTSAEKYRRSIRILGMVREALGKCTARPGASADLQQLFTEADMEINAGVPPHVSNEAAESVLTLAENLWREGTACNAERSASGNPIALLMKKLAS